MTTCSSVRSAHVSATHPVRSAQVFDLSHFLQGMEPTACLLALSYLYGGPHRPADPALRQVLDDMRPGGRGCTPGNFISVHNQLIAGIQMTASDAERISEIIKIDVDDFSIIQRKMQCTLSAMFLCRHVYLPHDVESALKVIHGRPWEHVAFEQSMAVAMGEYVGFLAGAERDAAEMEFREAVERVLIPRWMEVPHAQALSGQPVPGVEGAVRMTGAEKTLVQFGVSLNEQRADNRWALVGAKLETFYAAAPPVTDARKRLLAQHAGTLRTASREIYSILPQADARREAMQREGRGTFKDILRKVFGWRRSAFSEASARMQGQSSAVWQRIPLLHSRSGRVIDADVLSISPPNLQSRESLAWDAFVDAEGRLNKSAYAAALALKNAQILACAGQQAPQRIVLPAFGGGVELAGLSGTQAKIAENIARDNMVTLVKALGNRGMVIQFAAAEESDPFWKRVNEKLGKQRALVWTGSGNPADWMESGDLLMNNVSTGQFAGQPLGNGVDAALGECSLLLDAHVFGAACWEVFGK